MTAKSKSVGRNVHYDLESERWVYSDTKKPVGDRTCKNCRQFVQSIKPDPCLGKLPGVKYACCGHGDSRQSYIVFENGLTIRGFEITEY